MYKSVSNHQSISIAGVSAMINRSPVRKYLRSLSDDELTSILRAVMKLKNRLWRDELRCVNETLRRRQGEQAQAGPLTAGVNGAAPTAANRVSMRSVMHLSDLDLASYRRQLAELYGSVTEENKMYLDEGRRRITADRALMNDSGYRPKAVRARHSVGDSRKRS